MLECEDKSSSRSSCPLALLGRQSCPNLYFFSSLTGAFMGAMSDAIFQIVEADKDLIVAYLRGKGLSAAQIRAKPARYFKQHCR
jgi:hypothetical protein